MRLDSHCPLCVLCAATSRALVSAALPPPRGPAPAQRAWTSSCSSSACYSDARLALRYGLTFIVHFDFRLYIPNLRLTYKSHDKGAAFLRSLAEKLTLPSAIEGPCVPKITPSLLSRRGSYSDGLCRVARRLSWVGSAGL